MFLIGFPEPSGAGGKSVQRVVTVHRNTITGFDRGFQVYYSTPSDRGMSGSPGLLFDGSHVCMHRAAGASAYSLGLGKPQAYFNVGLRRDLFVKHAWDPEEDLEAAPITSVQELALWNDEIKGWYQNNA